MAGAPASDSRRAVSRPVEIAVLGPVRLQVSGEVVEIAAKKPRALLAMLAMEAGRVVSTDVIIDGLWGDEPPDSAANAVQVYIGGLRRLLGPERARLRTQSPGYTLDVDPDDVDAIRFERAVGPSGVDDSTGLARALGEWRGPPFEDLVEIPFARAHITRLSELRLMALERRIEADLVAGRHDEVIAELETLVSAEPYRERLWRQLSTALYRAGRQADALSAIRRVRRILRDELGLDPGPSLVALERAILEQDPALTLGVADPVGVRVPVPPSSLIGRQVEQRDLVDLVGRHRFVTLTGLGGVGKTRLATSVGLASSTRERFPGGIVFVDLSGADDRSLILPEASRVAGVTVPDAPASVLAARLGERPSLVILDNLEQIADAGGVILEMLRGIPALHVLATSRLPMRVTSEYLVHLQPLGVDDAVELFRERASTGPDGFDGGSIRAIAERVDGLPLAIELAAAASRAVPTDDLLERLAKRLPLPGGPRDLPARQRTLEATLDWSLGLLAPRSRELLDAVTVFGSPFDIAAVEAVGGGEDGVIDALADLVEASLISVDNDRYRMLPSIRDVLRERTHPDLALDLADRHAAWIMSTADAAYAEMHGGDEVEARRRTTALLPDIRSALEHLLRTARHEDAALVLLRTTMVWFHEGLFAEFQQRMAASHEGTLTDRTRAEVSVMRGVIGWLRGEAVESLAFIRAGIAILRAQAPRSVFLMNGLCHLAAASAEQGHRDEAIALADEAVEVARRVDDPGSLPLALEFAGYVAFLLGDGERAVAACEAAVDANRAIDSPQLCTALAGLAAALDGVGRRDEAIRAGWEAIEAAERSGSTQQVAETIGTVAPVIGANDPSEIAERLAEAIATYIAFGTLAPVMDACLILAKLAASSRPEEAARLLGAMEVRGRDRVPAEVRRLGDEVRERLGPRDYAHQHALGARLGDDDVARLARDLAASLRAAAIA